MKTAEILEFTTDGYGRINGQTILSGSSLTSENVILQAVHHQASIGIATDPFIMAENHNRYHLLAISTVSSADNIIL